MPRPTFATSPRPRVGASLALSLFASLTLPALTLAVDSSPPFETFTYKRVGALEIKADVYRPAGEKKPRPVVVYIHGGSLINGGRQSLWKPIKIRDQLLASGIVIVSIDYRLAPETKLPVIIEDVEDAFRWVRDKGPRLFGADPQRVAAAGGSAGGYLTLLVGHRVKPRPVALLAESSYCDLIGPWQRNPSIHPPHYKDSALTENEAWRQVSGPAIANSNDRHGDGSAFNDFIRRNAGWPRAISGWDPKVDGEKFIPYMPIQHVTRDYPPTMMIHGELDSDVPRDQPETMARELQRHQVPNTLIIIPGGEHGYRGADPALIDAAQAKAVAFLRTHLGVSP